MPTKVRRAPASKMRTKLTRQIGIVVTGEALLNLWGGGQGLIEMYPKFIPNGKITHNHLLNCINDAEFGCESIAEATLDISIKYCDGATELDRSLIITYPPHLTMARRGIKIIPFETGEPDAIISLEGTSKIL